MNTETFPATDVTIHRDEGYAFATGAPVFSQEMTDRVVDGAAAILVHQHLRKLVDLAGDEISDALYAVADKVGATHIAKALEHTDKTSEVRRVREAVNELVDQLVNAGDLGHAARVVGFELQPVNPVDASEGAAAATRAMQKPPTRTPPPGSPWATRLG